VTMLHGVNFANMLITISGLVFITPYYNSDLINSTILRTLFISFLCFYWHGYYSRD